MTLDQLRYFVAAAKYEHINRAARSIPISASVISSAVHHLEEEFQIALFTRDKKRIRLTAQGIRFLELSVNLLAQSEGLKQELGRPPLHLSGHYRIGASHFLATKLVAPAWTQLQKAHPNLIADICAQPTWFLVDQVLAGRLDFAVGFSPAQHPQLECTAIHQGNLQVVVRKNHPIFTSAKRDHYRQLANYSATMHIASEKILNARPHPVLRAAGLDPKITFAFDNDFVALENLRASDNWCFMIDIIARAFQKYLRVVPIPRTAEALYTIQIFKHKSRRTDAAMTEAFRLIRESATVIASASSYRGQNGSAHHSLRHDRRPHSPFGRE